MSNQDCQPSAFGFRNIQPKTRQERRGHYDKVSLEKSRIDQRVGFEARIHQANAPKHSSQLTSCLSEGAGYISNADRFHCDTAGEEYATRQDAIQRKNRAIEFRRNQSVAREEDRWQQMEEKRIINDEHARRLRDEGSACKKNASNVAYDILSLQYNQDTGGEKQKYEDDMVRYRAQLRSRNITVKGDTRSGFDIISGTQRDPPAYPQSVINPSRGGTAASCRGQDQDKDHRFDQQQQQQQQHDSRRGAPTGYR